MKLAIIGFLLFMHGYPGCQIGKAAVSADKKTESYSYLLKEASPGTNTITLLPPSFTTNYSLTFPTTDGDASQVLTTNGSGVLSWSSPATSISSGSIVNTASADGISIEGSVVRLRVADATFGGALSAGAQSISGEKRFADRLKVGSTAAVISDSAFEVSGTDRGSRPLPLTATSNINPGSAGVMTYDPTINAPAYYDGTSWQAMNTVSQASYYGGAQLVGATGCIFSENTSSGATNFIDLGTGSGCNTWSVSGNITAQATNDHRVVATNMPEGEYLIILDATFTYSGGSQNCYFRLSDGTNTSVGNWGTPGGAAGSNSRSFRMSYTGPPTTRTFKIQAADDGANSCTINANGPSADDSWEFLQLENQ